MRRLAIGLPWQLASSRAAANTTIGVPDGAVLVARRPVLHYRNTEET